MKNPKWFWKFLPDVIKCKVLDYLNTPHESVTLLYVSKYFRKYILNFNYKYFYLSTGFCSVKYWDNIFKKKNVYILQKNFNNDDFIFTFDFEKTCHKFEVTFCHIPLSSVCFHLLTCLRSCDKVTNYCFYCSRVREHTYGDKSCCHDVVVANQVRSYKDDYMFLQDKIADFDVFIDKPMYMNYQNFPLNNSKCDYYTELRHAQELFVPFINVLARLYINYGSE